MRLIIATVAVAVSAWLAECRDVGILYEVWHTKPAQAMGAVAARGLPQLTTELVIQSQGTLTLDDVYKGGAASDIYNVQPELGFYCLYRARPGQVAPIPDCPNISVTARAHADMLVTAGVDYVAVDVTNWPKVDVGGSTDIAVLRPLEVLVEEWRALRTAGVATPQIAAWPCSPAGVSNMTWQYILDTIYNNPLNADLIYTQAGKQVMFVPYAGSNCYDAGARSAIASNSGRDNVVAIPMWALFGDGGGDVWKQGVWAFFSPCVDAIGDFTTSMVGVGPCNQYATYSNDTGHGLIEVSASGGYMTSQCALPFASPGHLRGLTLARLFERVLAVGAPHLFMSSFNEHIGGRQAPASWAKIAFNMGLPTDPQRNSVWVDTYASEFSRDIEPSREGGNATWAVAVACIGLYKASLTCADKPQSLCCTRADKEVFANVWSLRRKDNSDALLTQLVDPTKLGILGFVR